MDTFDWMMNPFIANVNKTDVTCQEILLEIRYSDESITNLNIGGYVQHWQNQKMPNLYPNMWEAMFTLLITFPTSCLA